MTYGHFNSEAIGYLLLILGILSPDLTPCLVTCKCTLVLNLEWVWNLLRTALGGKTRKVG